MMASVAKFAAGGVDKGARRFDSGRVAEGGDEAATVDLFFNAVGGGRDGVAVGCGHAWSQKIKNTLPNVVGNPVDANALQTSGRQHIHLSAQQCF